VALMQRQLKRLWRLSELSFVIHFAAGRSSVQW